MIRRAQTLFHGLLLCWLPALVILVASCRPAPATPPPSPTPPLTPAAPSRAAEESPRAPEAPAGEATAIPAEEILILSPGPGSRLTSPARVAGEAEPTFEQNLVVRIIGEAGEVLAEVPTTIAAGLGERGPFDVEVPFDVEREQQGLLQVLSTSPRDGGVTHLSSAGVTLAPDGQAEVAQVEAHPERIVIEQPALGETVQGGVAHVVGHGVASFEQTLVVEVLDGAGNVVGSQAVTIAAPEMGQAGPFSADVPYTVDEAGPGRIVVRDPSPALEGDLHLSSVEVQLEAEGG